jgi:hypothetical protein
VQTYIDSWPLMVMVCCVIGLYLMSVNHTLKGLWVRTSASRLVGQARRLWRIARGRPVEVVPLGHGRRGGLSKRHIIRYR